MKKIIIITVIIVAGAIFSFSFNPEKKEKIAYDTFSVKKGDISKTITATGTVEPITQVEVGTQVSGTIARIHVDFNDIVKKGQLIAELDRTVLESELASQTAMMKSNQNELEFQQKNYERTRKLHAKNLVSETDFESAVYQYNKAKQAYEKSCSDLIKAKTNLSYAIIYSPIDGVVISRAVDEGQTVAATFSTPTLFTIANDLKRMQVIANVDEADIGQVTEGQRVTFFVDAFPEDQFEGLVTQVRLEPTTTANVVTYEVVIDAPNPELKLKPGLTANITVYTLQKNNILIAPLRALRFHPTGPEFLASAEQQPANKNERILWIETDNTLRPQPVRTGISDGIFVEITEGIQEGNIIIIGLQQETTSARKKGGSPFMPAGMGGKPH